MGTHAFTTGFPVIRARELLLRDGIGPELRVCVRSESNNSGNVLSVCSGEVHVIPATNCPLARYTRLDENYQLAEIHADNMFKG